MYQDSLRQYTFVNGLEGAKAYPMLAGQTMLLMDSDKPIIFMKTTDAIGKPSLRYFLMKELSEEEIQKQYAPKPTQDYVSKEDFNALNEKLNNVLALLQKEGVSNE
jgi:hypothetical protein